MIGHARSNKRSSPWFSDLWPLSLPSFSAAWSRWRDVLHLPANYAHINELTEWYVVSRSAVYRVISDAKKPRELTGDELIDGDAVQTGFADTETRITETSP